MSFIGWIIIGGLAGWIASGIMKEKGGFFRNIIVGIIGGLLGGWLFELFDLNGIGDFGWLWNLLVAAVGAVVLLWLLRLVTGKK